jgi:hypothetical protein
MNVPFQDNGLIRCGFEISLVYFQYFAPREEYQDVAVLLFRE